MSSTFELIEIKTGMQCWELAGGESGMVVYSWLRQRCSHVSMLDEMTVCMAEPHLAAQVLESTLSTLTRQEVWDVLHHHFTPTITNLMVVAVLHKFLYTTMDFPDMVLGCDDMAREYQNCCVHTPFAKSHFVSHYRGINPKCVLRLQ
jgi:hypothetical protein